MDLSANILLNIIDDDQDLHEVMKTLLTSNGVPENKIHITGSPQSFLEKLTSDINIACIDHRLDSDIDGLMLIDIFKKKNKRNYVIVITGQRDYGVVIEYLKKGADDYIDKNPRNGDYLNDFVSAVLKGFEQAKERVKEEQAMKLFHEAMKKRMQETAELTKKLR